jgi:hypothetical protein
MIAVRAIPGAGKNFIATLLSKHYHSDNVMYYDKIFNEYFHSPYIIHNNLGYIKQPFWNGKNWDIIPSVQIENPIIMHEHEWINDGTGLVNGFKIYDQTNGKIGLKSNWINYIVKGFFIYCDKQNEIDFVQKMLHIKVNGSRPLIVYDEKTESSTAEYSFEAQKLRLIGSLGKGFDLRNMIDYAMTKMTYKEWIYMWKQFCIFVNQFPYMVPFSFHNIIYFHDWLNDDMKWDLFNSDIFLLHLEIWKKKNKNLFNLEYEKNKLNEIEKFKNRYGMQLYKINYSDLFFYQKPTGTVLDNYMDEIKKYSERNMKLLCDYESFYGKIL